MEARKNCRICFIPESSERLSSMLAKGGEDIKNFAKVVQIQLLQKMSPMICQRCSMDLAISAKLKDAALETATRFSAPLVQQDFVDLASSPEPKPKTETHHFKVMTDSATGQKVQVITNEAGQMFVINEAGRMVQVATKAAGGTTAVSAPKQVVQQQQGVKRKLVNPIAKPHQLLIKQEKVFGVNKSGTSQTYPSSAKKQCQAADRKSQASENYVEAAVMASQLPNLTIKRLSAPIPTNKRVSAPINKRLSMAASNTNSIITSKAPSPPQAPLNMKQSPSNILKESPSNIIKVLPTQRKIPQRRSSVKRQSSPHPISLMDTEVSVKKYIPGEEDKFGKIFEVDVGNEKEKISIKRQNGKRITDKLAEKYLNEKYGTDVVFKEVQPDLDPLFKGFQ